MQRQLILPILEALEERGGKANVRDLYGDVADKAKVNEVERQRRQVVGKNAQTVNLYERDVRWAQQRAKFLGLVDRVSPRHWQITGKGRTALREARPGVVITLYVDEDGAALFGRCEDTIGYIADGTVQLVLTSPPYPLQSEKAYGNRQVEEYVEWLLSIASEWPKKLTQDGSIVINLADVWEKGRPSISLYQERLLIRLVEDLGLRLCQRYAWLNPSKLPAPAEWVTVRRVRVKPSLEQIYWLSHVDHPYADNRAVLRPYSSAMKRRISAGGEEKVRRPSGHAFSGGAFGSDNGGSIPDNLIVAANTSSCDRYANYCRTNGLAIHPARFPGAIPRHFIQMLTREGDTVFDPFGGSLTTAAEAARFRRRWITTDMNLEYLVGGIGGRIKSP